MKRTPPALRQLVDQVKARGDEEPEVVGEVDGLGWYRSIKVKPATAKWLVPALSIIKDKRIASIEQKTSRSQAVITFVGDTRADHKTPFPVEEVNSILNGG